MSRALNRSASSQEMPVVPISDDDARALVAHAQIGLFVIQDEVVVFANPRFLDMLGGSAEQILGMHHTAVAAAPFRERVQARLSEHLRGDVPSQRQLRCVRLDGTEFNATVLPRLIDYQGRAAVVVSVTESDALMSLMHEARRSLRLLDRTETLSRSGSFQVKLGEGTVLTSYGLRALAGLDPETDLEGPLDDLPWLPPDERAYVASVWRAARPGEPFEIQHRLFGADGAHLIVLHRGLVEADEDGRPSGFGFVQDVTAQREAEQRAQELATHDEVTGLPNRTALLEKLEAAMLAVQWEDKSIALLSIDVARITEIRTKMGFGAGDMLAMALAARLKALLAADEWVAQVGDTEFVLLLEGPKQADVQHVMQRAAAVRDALQEPVRLVDTNVYPLCVIGLSGFPGDGDTASEVMESAQTARLSATAEASIVTCSPGSNARAVRALTIEAALRDALTCHEFELHYQPQVDLANGQVVGAEALLRWTSSVLGPVSPSEFVPVAESSGLIGSIGDWVFERACAQIVDWRAAGLPPLRVAVNLSPMQLQRPNLAGWIQALLLRTGANPMCLGVELTESAAMTDVDHAVRTLREIRALGVEVSLDDFGTGFSSLSCLRRLPIDVVKIDRAFVHDVTASIEDMSVTRSIISMVHGLHMKVLAEGVETEAQLGLLASHRCDLIQGYHFSPAVPAAEFARIVTERRRLPDRFLTRVRRERTLLLVDDEPGIVSSLKRLFRVDGYRIVTAQSGEEGLQRLADIEADVIISDQRMQGMTGVDFLRRAKELYPDSVRMVLSGYTELQSILDAINEGAIYKFLTKPWDDAQLREHVAEAFRRKALDDENRRLALRLECANVDYAELNARLERTVEQQREQSAIYERSAGNMREMLDSLPLPVFGVDADGVLVFGNREADVMLAEAGPDHGVELGMPVPASLQEAIKRAGTGGAAIEFAGRRFRVLTRPVPGQDDDAGQLLMLLPHTMTEVA